MTELTINDLDPNHELSDEVRGYTKVFLELVNAGDAMNPDTWFAERGLDPGAMRETLVGFADFNYRLNVEGHDVSPESIMRVALTLGTMFGFALCEERTTFKVVSSDG